MEKKNTQELENILQGVHISGFQSFLDANSDSLLQEENPFGQFIKEQIRKAKITQQKLFIRADIPEGYGYKLLSGEKHTRQRDVILRLCYAGELSLKDTQKALRIYELPELYAKVPRDAFIMICFNNRPGNILEVNELLRSNGFDSLKTSGVQD